MERPNEKINLYIADQTEEWKRKLLVRVRQLIHQADERIVENWRWNAPHFDLDGILIGMVAFKSHVAVWFHKGALLKDPHKLFAAAEKGDEKGLRAYKIPEGTALNEKAFLDLVKQAIALNEQGVKLHEAKPAKKAVVVPADLEAVLRKDEQAWAHWSAFSNSHRREYVEWITDAKREETRKRRIAEAFQMIREGAGLNDKHRVS